ncbi:UDP-glucose 4-epimerase GalE [Ferrimonas sp. YFM]|uniref:UDP-glucose 4-epimerase GalE n=1 Tax=Ferrimonas sp. YFM TaxID=3028878 RepID=UPI0025735D42|nr:UDP-glucose 4-epimerase GalE [Ferrimonas sp. YFM]BDY04084.1 UDP-glucose 4-epimerase [Ferrimonas sp. YFM]
MESDSSIVLVTGGCGYIGSHTLVELLNAGHQVVVVDNLSNGSDESLRRVQQITGKSVAFYKADLTEQGVLEAIFSCYPIDAVIHFAGLKAVGESVSQPLRYYQNNLVSTIALCEVMAKANVFNLVFSSSATVYGDPKNLPIREDFSVGETTNPYGTSKHMIERMLQDLHKSDSRWNIAMLRYFNPVGAHESGLIGEDPTDIPNNLMPYISQVAVGKREVLSVFGSDYDTVDGTGVRDYIHVVDLALGHLLSLNRLRSNPGLEVYNLGTGEGHSVLQVVRAFEDASQQRIPYQLVERRPGDIAACYADPSKAERELGWKATRDIRQMAQDTWRWQRLNPEGYPK